MTAGLLLLLVAASAALAVWGWRRVDTEAGYWVAGRSAGALLAGLGGTAAGLSAFVVVGGPGLFAALGAASLWIVASAPLTAALQCWAVGEPVVELTRQRRCLTVPDLVAARFGDGWPPGLTAIAVVIGGVAMLAVQIKGLAVFGGALLGAPGALVAAVAVLATTAYTAAGGMRAGLLAEALQGALMAGTAVALATFALAAVGGPAAAVEVIAAARPELLDPRHGVGGVGAVAWFALFALGTCAQPHYLQKFLLLRDRASLRSLPAVATGALLAVLTVWIGLGLGGTALWLGGGLELATPDELAAAFIARSGAAVVTVAAIAVLAAVMSTAATILNLMAAAAVRDLPKAVGRQPAQGLLWARLATVAAAAGGAVLALASERQVALLGVLGWGTFTSALFPALALGLNWPGATRRGAVAALAAGPAVQLVLEWLRAGGGLGPSWEPGLTGTAVGVVALVTVSRLDPAKAGRRR